MLLKKRDYNLMKKNKKPLVLVVLDGLGYSREKKGNAVALAHTPHLQRWFKEYPHRLIRAAGPAVGLPKGYIGNSEVGHLTLGSGRIIGQSLSVMLEAAKSGALNDDPKINSCFRKLIKNGARLHILGLLSDAGVHSHEKYLYAVINRAVQAGISKIYLHLFLDGRDVNPKTAQQYLEKLERKIKKYPQVTIGSLHGRFYAMDRNQNLDRTQKSFDILTKKSAGPHIGWRKIVTDFLKTNKSEEFLPPISLDPASVIQPKDGIFFFNFRPDRARQLTRMLLHWHNAPNLSFFITPYVYDPKVKTTVLYKHKPVKNTLTDILHAHHKSVFAIAETEKYAHITYFFNAGREKPYRNETWVFIPSLKPVDFTKHPAMSAPEITAAVVKSLQTDPHDVYLINYANADMVGHSGDLPATIQAIECLDKQLSLLYTQVIEKMDGILIITADHGNAEAKSDPVTGAPLTAHTDNRVPLLVIRNDCKHPKTPLPVEDLAGIAPLILHMLGLPIPKEMSRTLKK